MIGWLIYFFYWCLLVKPQNRHRFCTSVPLKSWFSVFTFLRQGDQAPSVQFKGHSPRHICLGAGSRVWSHVWWDQGVKKEERWESLSRERLVQLIGGVKVYSFYLLPQAFLFTHAHFHLLSYFDSLPMHVGKRHHFMEGSDKTSICVKTCHNILCGPALKGYFAPTNKILRNRFFLNSLIGQNW